MFKLNISAIFAITYKNMQEGERKESKEEWLKIQFTHLSVQLKAIVRYCRLSPSNPQF